MNKSSNKRKAKNVKSKESENKWSFTYDKSLLEIIENIGISDWEKVAENLNLLFKKEKTAEQCLNRWQDLIESVKAPSLSNQLLIIAANYEFKHSWKDVFLYSKPKKKERQQFFLYFYSKFKIFAANCAYQTPTIIKQFSNIDSLENLYFILITKKILKNQCETKVSKDIINEFGVKLSDCITFYKSILEKYGCKENVKIKLNELFKRTMETIWNKIQKEEPARDQTHESRGGGGEEINYINLIPHLQSLLNSNPILPPHFNYNLMFPLPLTLPHFNRMQQNYYTLFPPNIYPNQQQPNSQNRHNDDQNP